MSSEQDLIRIRREIEIMASLGHKHIIQIYEGELPSLKPSNQYQQSQQFLLRLQIWDLWHHLGASRMQHEGFSGDS